MTKFNKRSFIAVVLIVLLAASLMAETINDDPEAVSLYSKGKRLMREGSFFDAVQVFDELEARFGNSPNADLFIFNRSKANLYLYEYDKAIAGFQYFINNFPNSSYLAHAYYFMGNALYRKGKVSNAAEAYLKGYELSYDIALNDLLFNALVAAYENSSELSLSNTDFDKLDGNKKCRLIKEVARIYTARSEINLAASLLAACGESVDMNGVKQQVSDNALDIALVLPLSGELISFGEEIYNGAVIAAEEYREKTGRQINLSSYDSKGDPIEAARIVTELNRTNKIDAVIGPLTSEEASVASAVLNNAELPLVVPAATQAGLTRLSSTSYQLAPNIELEGHILAEYAYNYLKCDTAAIITSTTTENIRMSRAFNDRFKELGGTVVAVEYYRSRDNDFGDYLNDIKKSLLGVPADSAFLINNDGDTLEYKEIVARLDCLYITGNEKQLRQLLPQINYYNLSAQYLGNDGWGDPIVYQLGDDVTKGAVFCSPFLESHNSDQFLKLSVAYDKRYGRRAQRLAALGYDALYLIIKATENRAITRENINSGLKAIKSYHGASGLISFGAYRENTEMPLYQINGEQAQPINIVTPSEN